MRAIVEYDKDDLAMLIVRDCLAKFGTKVLPSQITWTVSKHDGSIVIEVNLKAGKESRHV